MSKQYNVGYEIIRRECVGNTEFVLGYNPEALLQYVTWKSTQGKGDYHWGYYFSDEKEAVKDFERRVRAERQG